MSDYERRFEAATTELDHAGIWRSNAVPPYMHALRKMGLSPVPPHYLPLWRSFLGQTAFFVLLICFVTFAVGAAPEGKTFGEALRKSCLIGLGLGVVMTAYFAYGRWKHELSQWDQL